MLDSWGFAMAARRSSDDGSYLSGGRQVAVVDLMINGLLGKGDELVLGVIGEDGEKAENIARLTSEGQIMLADKRVFVSPHKAAHEATGEAGIDGWSTWVRCKDGKTLDDLRQTFLEKQAKKERKEEGNGHLALALERHKRLKQARARADEHAPESVPVQELIGLWGATRRGQGLMQLIEVDLANHGLTTRPGLMEARPGDAIKLVHTLEGHDHLSPTVGALPSARVKVQTVRENAGVQEALTIMLLKDYSQVPVLSKNKSGVLRGVVTWKSLARAMNVDPRCSLRQATEPCDPVESHRELLDVIPEIQDRGFVLVNGEDGRISGIVTTTDVAQRYSDAAIPFLLIGVIDTLLRRTIAENVPMALINKLCAASEQGRPELKSVNNLTMGDYKRVLESPEAWERLGWPLDRAAFIKQLDAIVTIRNDVMHFNPDPLPEGCVVQLKSMIALVRDHGGV
ncbi:restriction system modified-DNA reader domain-containing protein [Nocardiopsis metallicus]|uniref:restriction system modified-DNA reader domain-containing protein n=2 Tax=Nocardiopsis metallicus TaxID=179819 RepID=UPI0028A83B28|nr:CBS domain-containing protein [Nocardiopsis metallicus]